MSFPHALPQFLEEHPTLHNSTHVIGVGLKLLRKKRQEVNPEKQRLIQHMCSKTALVDVRVKIHPDISLARWLRCMRFDHQHPCPLEQVAGLVQTTPCRVVF